MDRMVLFMGDREINLRAGHVETALINQGE
jgi:hypothetical protein